MARILVLRPGRRRAAWEEEPPDPVKIIATDFRYQGTETPDLEPSVYMVPVENDASVGPVTVRILAEHFASFLFVPPTTVYATNAEGLNFASQQEDPGGRFEFIRNHHHFLKFEDVPQLAAFVLRVRAEFATRCIVATRDDLFRYIQDRLSNQDREWIAVCADGQPGAKWKESARKRLEAIAREDARAERDRQEKARIEAKKALGMKNWQEKTARLERERLAREQQQGAPNAETAAPVAAEPQQMEPKDPAEKK